MPFIGFAWLFAKLLTVGNLIFNRVASWTGALYFYKRGKKTGKKAYYVLAGLIYVSSWVLVILCSSRVWVWIQR